jgi:hypothetical protein
VANKSIKDCLSACAFQGAADAREQGLAVCADALQTVRPIKPTIAELSTQWHSSSEAKTGSPLDSCAGFDLNLARS